MASSAIIVSNSLVVITNKVKVTKGQLMAIFTQKCLIIVIFGNKLAKMLDKSQDSRRQVVWLPFQPSSSRLVITILDPLLRSSRLRVAPVSEPSLESPHNTINKGGTDKMVAPKPKQ